MPRVGFEHTIAAGERPYTYALDRAATGTGFLNIYSILIVGLKIFVNEKAYLSCGDVTLGLYEAVICSKVVTCSCEIWCEISFSPLNADLNTHLPFAVIIRSSPYSPP